eukprot:12019250-Alexandrium_andersonii.AAC.1
MLPNGVSIRRLGQHISGIVSAWPLNEFEAPGSDSLLNPQMANSQMAHPPNARAAADANSGAAIGIHAKAG